MDPLGNLMAAVNNKGRCFIWKLSGGGSQEPTKLNPCHKIEAHSKFALKCAFSPDSRYVLQCIAFIRLLLMLLNYTAFINQSCHSFSPFLSLLVTTSADQSARVWRTTDFTLLTELKQEGQRWVWDAAFSADSQYIVTGMIDCHHKF